MENFLVYLPYVILLVGVGLMFCFKKGTRVKLATMAMLFIWSILLFVDYDVGKIVFMVLVAVVTLLLNRRYLWLDIKNSNPIIWIVIALEVIFAIDMAGCWFDNKLWQLCLQSFVAILYTLIALRYAVKNSCQN